MGRLNQLNLSRLLLEKKKTLIFFKNRRTYPVDFLYKMPLLFNYTLSLYTRIDL